MLHNIHESPKAPSSQVKSHLFSLFKVFHFLFSIFQIFHFLFLFYSSVLRFISSKHFRSHSEKLTLSLSLSLCKFDPNLRIPFLSLSLSLSSLIYRSIVFHGFLGQSKSPTTTTIAATATGLRHAQIL